jgi:hypothetical protein
LRGLWWTGSRRGGAGIVARKEMSKLSRRDSVKEQQPQDAVKIDVRSSAKMKRRSIDEDDDEEVRHTPQDGILKCLQGGRDCPLTVCGGYNSGWAKLVTVYRRPNRRVRRRRRGSSLCC